MANAALSSSSMDKAQSPDTTNARRSGVQFTSDTTMPGQSGKSSRRDISSSNEVTPIAKSDDHVKRSYNTSATTLAVTTPPPAASRVSQQSSSSDATKVDVGSTWYKRIAEKYGSVALENKASVARDHLALERTFLAWLRTSLSFASIGIAITQLFRLNTGGSTPSKRGLAQALGDQLSASRLPFSPYLGHALPAELIPYLQAAVVPAPEVGPTLLDQMFGLSVDGASVNSNLVFTASTVGVETADKLRHVGKPLGATFIGISVIVLLVGFQRYFEAQHWIIHGKFPASRASITLVTFAAVALVMASLVIIIVISPTQQET